jgi:hypothetical protein
MAICPSMDGKKCATTYCDYWDHEEQRCSLALESHKRVELLNAVLEKAEELLMNAKEKEDLAKIVKEFNIISVSKTLQ